MQRRDEQRITTNGAPLTTPAEFTAYADDIRRFPHLNDTSPYYWPTRSSRFVSSSLISQLLVSSFLKITQDCFIRAATSGDLNVVKRYLEENKGNTEAINCCDSLGTSALHRASKYGYVALVKVLLSAGANVNAVNYKKVTPLIFAAASGDLATIIVLLEAKADVNAVNENGDTALMAAVSNKLGISCVYALLAAGADVNMVNKKGLSALRVAAMFDNFQSLQALLVAPSINLVMHDQGERAINMAKISGHGLIEAVIKDRQFYYPNGTQRNVIQAVMSFHFDAVSDLLPHDAIYALEAMFKKPETILPNDVVKFKRQNVWECIRQIHAIFSHPYPQNCGASYPYVCQEAGFCMVKIDRARVDFQDANGNIVLKNGVLILKTNVVRNWQDTDYLIIKEETGLLSLTKWDDDKTLPITKMRVDLYIHQLISEQIKQEVERYMTWNHAATVIQGSYRRHLFFKQSKNHCRDLMVWQPRPSLAQLAGINDQDMVDPVSRVAASLCAQADSPSMILFLGDNLYLLGENTGIQGPFHWPTLVHDQRLGSTIDYDMHQYSERYRP